MGNHDGEYSVLRFLHCMQSSRVLFASEHTLVVNDNANSRATTKMALNRSITDVLREERKWNDTTCSVKIREGRKRKGK